ncbi:SOUL hem-binding protein [Dioscorea alata]|uniref:SOUL hem-binding protein n=1 Tax=Dioscorea alata TaxID=55571 RepID=A0ACB7W4B9_DIOAL|nr:SOUL hem-binding protein [Dioscorea alata]
MHSMRLLTVFALSSLLVAAVGVAGVEVFPPTCERIECAEFVVIGEGNGYEIRRYDSAVWMSTSPIDDISLVNATRTGFFQLFDYIQGKNEYGETIEMTGPVMSQISPSDGPFCKSSFVVSFSVPKKNQANPPPAEGLHVQKWQSKFLAVRQFGGFVSDDTIGQQADALFSSLTGSNWASAIDPSGAYAVAQYNSPFEFSGRVNEVWITLDLHASAM